MVMARSIAGATARRLRQGPLLPSWNWAVELGTAAIRGQLLTAFKLDSPVEQRRFLDALVIASGPPAGVSTKTVDQGGIRGRWHRPANPAHGKLLYLHGGGFAVYPQASYRSFISLVALTTRLETFAADYRLSPEHPFPAALDDSRATYLWLLDQGIDPAHLAIAGDSAGGNLTISLLCDLRDRKIPLPALGIALSPATEFDTIRASMATNDPYDWITGMMALTWRDWYCRPDERSLPLVSPIHADLRGLPPIYLQAGRAEILYDSICTFAITAKDQGANVRLDTWPDMNHVFQFFGNDAPQSREALGKIRELAERIFH
jgi:acetyl esterase/lipase